VKNSLETRIGIDHPTAAGHFPGNPIIPGAVLLDEVLSAMAAGGAGFCRIRSAKFLQPVRPGDRILIRWQEMPSGQAKFECLLLDPERLALSGLAQRGE
jgi:3-hydroxyacyl-[acyl-carrier-protein] dehydratase